MKVDGAPYLCKTDEVGEICVSSSATGTAYYGLLGVTRSVFEVGARTVKLSSANVDGMQWPCAGLWPLCWVSWESGCPYNPAEVAQARWCSVCWSCWGVWRAP